MPRERSERPTDRRTRLRRHWRRVCQRLGFTGETQKVCRELLARYAEPWRVYHNLSHLEDCRDTLRFEVELEDDTDIGIAILFHDAVYVIGAADNEERSADLARVALASCGARPEFIARVERLILATDHRRPLLNEREGVICDIDLSILGRDAETYDRYAAGIRSEAGLPDAEYWPHRRAFLRSMLAGEHIFHTAHFRAKFEAPARANMQRELERSSQAAGRHHARESSDGDEQGSAQ